MPPIQGCNGPTYLRLLRSYPARVSPVLTLRPGTVTAGGHGSKHANAGSSFKRWLEQIAIRQPVGKPLGQVFTARTVDRAPLLNPCLPPESKCASTGALAVVLSANGVGR